MRALDWVMANPAGTATDTLATIRIGNVLYALSGGGTSDGVFTGGSVSGGTATFTRSVGADVDVTGFFAPANLIAGAGITITPGSGQNLTLAANAQPFALYEEGIELTGNLLGINFRGHEVTVVNLAQNVANVRFGSILQDNGTQLSEDGAGTVNYTGVGVNPSFNSTTGTLTVNVPGGTTLTANATSGILISGSAISFSPTRLPRLGASEPAARSDDLVLKNESDGNFPGLISIQNFLTGIAGDNLSVDADGRQLNAAAGGGGTADGVVDSLDFDAGTRVLTATRTNGLADLTETLPGDGTGPVESLPAADVTYSNSGAQVDIDGAGTGAPVMGQIVSFQYRGAFTAADTGMSVSYNGLGVANLIIKDTLTRRQMTLNDFTRYDYFMVQKAAPDWIMVGGSQHIYRFAHTAIQNSGTELIDNAGTINFATGVTATVSGETVTVEAAGGLAAVATESPVSGDGTTGTPVTVADGALNLVHLSSGARYYRGDWNSLQTYARGQSVEHDAHLWINAFGASAGDEPSETSTVWYRIDHRPTAIQNSGTEIIDNASTINFAAGVTATVVGETVTVTAAGTGGGDITSVSTASDSGLAGGAAAGDVALSLDVKNLPIYDTPISHLDHLPITDESVAGDPTRRLTLTQYATWAAGQANGGIGAADGKFHIQPNELLLSTTPANADRLVGWDQSAFVPRAFELDTLRSYFRTVAANPGGSPSDSLTTISIDGTSYSIEGAGTGDITAVNTPTNSGMLGGETTGAVTLGLDVSNLQGYNTTLSELDHLALSDEGEAGDPTRRINLEELATWQAGLTGGGISAVNGQFRLRAAELGIPSVVADNDRFVGLDFSASETRAWEADDLQAYFQEGLVAANPGGTPADTLTTVTIDGTDYSIEGGGGGSLTVTRDDVANVSFTEEVNTAINFASTNLAVDTGIAVPANTKTILANWGSSYTAAVSGIDLPWFSIPIEEWERLDGVDVGDTPTQGNTRFTRTWRDTNITTGGGTAARQIWISRGNNGNIFVFTDNVGYDIYPFRVRFEIHETLSVVTDVTGGGGGGSTTFVALTDTPADITADECVMGNAGGDALEFGACATGGGGASTFTALTDTPAAITADECVRGNTGGTALEFGACGTGGGGDITSVTTATTSGLSGGANTGDVALSLDVSALATYSSTLSGTDHIVLSDEGQVGNPTRRLTLSAYATWVAGQAQGGIAATNGRLHIQPNELLISTAVADADRLMGWDQSSFAPRSWEASTLRDYFGAGGGGGDITAVLTGSGSGLTGGTTSGSANLAIGNLAVTTPRLASNAVTTNKIASGAVGTTDLANRAVTGGKIASSVSLAGNPTTTTQADSDDSTRIATTAFVQANSGGGTGDITAVTTASGSGLAGGVLTGAADLSLSLNGMGSGGALEGRDEFPFDDKSDATQRTFLTSFENHAVWLAGATDGGIGAGTEGLVMDIDDLVTISTISEDDHMAIADDTIASRDTRRTTVGSFVSGTAGYGIRNDGDGNYRLDFDGLGSSQGIDPSEDKMVIWNESETGVHPNLIDMNTYFLSVTDQNVFGFDDTVAGDGLEIRDGGIGAELLEDDILNQLTTAAAVDPDADFVAFVDRSAGDTKKVQVADLFDSAMGNQFARDSDGEVIIAANGITNYAIANSAITQQKIAANAVRSTEIANGSIEPEDHADPDLLVNDVAYTSSPTDVNRGRVARLPAPRVRV